MDKSDGSPLRRMILASHVSAWLKSLHYHDLTVAGLPVRLSGICVDTVTVGQLRNVRIYKAKESLFERIFGRSLKPSIYWEKACRGREFKDFHCQLLGVATVPAGEHVQMQILASQLEGKTPWVSRVNQRLIFIFADSGGDFYPVATYDHQRKLFSRFLLAACSSLPLVDDKRLAAAISELDHQLKTLSCFSEDLDHICLYGVPCDDQLAIPLKRLDLKLTSEYLIDLLPSASPDRIKSLLAWWRPPNIPEDPMFRPLISAVLRFCKSSERTEISGALIRSGVDVSLRDKFGFSALHYAAIRGDGETIACILDAGAEADVRVTKSDDDCMRSCEGATPLHFALANGCAEDARILLGRGADVCAETVFKEAPLHWLVGRSEVICEALLVRGANYRIRDNNGATALHWSAEHNVAHSERWGVSKHTGMVESGTFHANPRKIAELLFSVGMNANDVDNNGNTPLHWACQYDNLPVAEALMIKGANVNIMNDRGRCPIDIAISRINVPLTERLLQADFSTKPLSAELDDVAVFLGKHTFDPQCRAMADLLAEHDLLPIEKTKKDLYEKLEIARDTGIGSVDIDNFDHDPFYVPHELNVHLVVEMVDELLKQGSDVNHTNSAGSTALLLSAGDQGMTVRGFRGRFKALFWRDG